MLCMEKLSYDFRLPGRSIREVHERFKQALLDHQKGRAIRFRGNQLTSEAFVNAIMLHFLALSHSAQTDVLREFVPRFEALLNGSVGGDQAGETSPGAVGQVYEPPPGSVAGRKPKRGKTG